MRPSAGPNAGKDLTWTAADYCTEIDRSRKRLKQITGKKPLRLFRAAGGKTSPRLLAAAKSCGYEHVAWSAAGFLGDELPSETNSNQALLTKALRDIRPGDILLMHLGIWSRKDPWRRPTWNHSSPGSSPGASVSPPCATTRPTASGSRAVSDHAVDHRPVRDGAAVAVRERHPADHAFRGSGQLPGGRLHRHRLAARGRDPDLPDAGHHRAAAAVAPGGGARPSGRWFARTSSIR